MSARILITGASGFVGRAVLRHLPDDDLHCVSRSRQGENWYTADFSNVAEASAVVRDVHPDILIHCAWETEHGAFWHASSNELWADAGKEMLAAFKEVGGQRVVVTGTCAEYPFLDRPLREEDAESAPSTTYGAAKLSLLRFLEKQDLSFAWPRIFHCYGPGENPARFVPLVCRALSEGRAIETTSGKQMRDFIEVDDLARAIAHLAHAKLQGAINLGSGETTTLGEISSRVVKIAGAPDLVQLGALPDSASDSAILVPDLSRQTHELGFAPKITLQEGLSRAFKYWAREENETSEMRQQRISS